MQKHTQPRVRKFSPRPEARVRPSDQQRPAIFWTTDADLCFTSLQGSGLSLLDLPPESLLGVCLTDYFQRQDPDLRLVAAHHQALEGEGSSFGVTWGGHTFEVQIEPLRSDAGEITGAVGFARETTGQKTAVPSSSFGEARYRALIENSTDLMALVGENATILYASPSTTRILGYPLEEFVGHNAFELIHPEDRDYVQRLFGELLGMPCQSLTAAYRLLAKDGTWRWIEGSCKNLLSEPAIQAIVVNYRDVTERQQTEEALRQAEENYRSIVENAIEGIFQTTPDGAYVRVNPAL